MSDGDNEGGGRAPWIVDGDLRHVTAEEWGTLTYAEKLSFGRAAMEVRHSKFQDSNNELPRFPMNVGVTYNKWGDEIR